MFKQLKAYIYTLSEREFILYASIGVGIMVCITAGVGYYGYASVKKLKKKISVLNTQRQEAQLLLSTFEQVKQQQASVAAELEKDKSFKIVGYVDSVLGNLNLVPLRASSTQTEQPLEYLPEYTEIKVVVHFTNMNMKQLTELLHEFEKNERIYTKELEITRSSGQQTIDVTLAVATLQRRTPEVEES